MSSLKIVGAILIIISSYLLGEMLFEKLNNRLLALKELHKVGCILKANIRHIGSDIEEALQEIVNRVNNEIQGFIEDIIEQIKTRKVADMSFIWKEAVSNRLKNIGFSEDEIKIINRLGENIGYMDREMQIESIDLYLNELEEKIEILKIELRQKRKLYKTLGIGIGMIIVLIIV